MPQCTAHVGQTLSASNRTHGSSTCQPQIFVSEYASHGEGAGYGNPAGAIGEAAFMNGLQRNAQIIRVVSYAPFLDNVNALNWHPSAV